MAVVRGWDGSQTERGIEIRPVAVRTVLERTDWLDLLRERAGDEGDTRITKVGAVLRRTSIDELPNLVNILRGEMSIVGPRPTLQVQVDQYTERQLRRLEARPGLTGWAQVNGRASLPWPERIELDIWYLENATLRLDLRIIALSARMAVTGHGLYRGETGGWRGPM
jgi:lipopolysaccharide/colanic/teichoic acid biosynthesis glycosyltransferase